jgi:hypothetical protein
MQTEMNSKIVGISFRDDGEDRQLNVKLLVEGQQLYWIHESDNRFDPCAIKIFADENHRHTLGYLQKELARDLIQQMREHGYSYDIFCTKITGANGQTKGCNVRIVAKDN